MSYGDDDKYSNPRYQAAIKRRIAYNAKVGNLRKMPPEVRALADTLDADARRHYERRLARMDDEERIRNDYESAEWHLENFTGKWGGNERSQVSVATTIIDQGSDNWLFGDKLVAAFIVYGRLSEKQMDWVRNLPEKMIEKEKERAEAKEARRGSEWVGDLKERLRDLSLTVTFTKVFEGGEWGATMLVRFTDADGNEFAWFGTGADAWKLDKGDEVILTGTVKKHTTYDGIKETVLTRCKVTSDSEAK